MILPPELSEEIYLSLRCRSRWLDLIVRVLDYLGLTNIPTERLAPVTWAEFTPPDGPVPLYTMRNGKYHRVSWSPFHRNVYRYWNNWLIFWLRVKYWIKLGAWF